MPLSLSKICGTDLLDVHLFLQLDPQGPPQWRFRRARYTIWLEPPQFCSACLHNRKVLISCKYPMGERTREATDQWVSCERCHL